MSQPTEREMRTLEVVRLLREAKQKREMLWSILFAQYSKTPAYTEYNQARELVWELEKELESLQ